MSALSADGRTEDVVIGIDLGTTFSCVAAWDNATASVKVSAFMLRGMVFPVH